MARSASDFTSNRGWLWRFKKSYDLRLINMHGESADADKCAAERFIQQFPQILETNEISDDNLYNMDETSLFWKMLPNKTLASANENRITGKKIKKDRITLALCANASGNHKSPVLFINRYENPRVLKNCKNNLPVIYMHHKNSWMNRVLFQSWYENEFKPRVRKRQLQENSIGKVLLILDNFSGHKLSDEEMDDGYFQIMFLPPNTSSLIQPMDQGVIAKFKKHFRHKLLRQVLQYTGGVSDFYADYDIKDCIDIVSECWNNITATNIFNAWNKICNRETRFTNFHTSSSATTSCDAAYETISGEEVTEWINHCGETETIRENVVEEEEEFSPVPIEQEEIDKLLHYLEMITIRVPEIANQTGDKHSVRAKCTPRFCFQELVGIATDSYVDKNADA
uniref:jerky protein homolog-like n=1 Tax=Osmia lignaria TaxID=473952 RepID=UPI00147980ED|nr:jerky protein homolog-like [Osmia lignaria]